MPTVDLRVPGEPPNPWGWPMAPIWTYTPCDHCWCEQASYPEHHAKCCKCSTVMHHKFLPAIARPEDGA